MKTNIDMLCKEVELASDNTHNYHDIKVFADNMMRKGYHLSNDGISSVTLVIPDSRKEKEIRDDLNNSVRGV